MRFLIIAVAPFVPSLVIWLHELLSIVIQTTCQIVFIRYVIFSTTWCIIMDVGIAQCFKLNLSLFLSVWDCCVLQSIKKHIDGVSVVNNFYMGIWINFSDLICKFIRWFIIACGRKLKWWYLWSNWFRRLRISRHLLYFVTWLLHIVPCCLNNNILCYLTCHCDLLSNVEGNELIFNGLHILRLLFIISCTSLNAAARVCVLGLLRQNKWWHLDCFLLHWLIRGFNSVEYEGAIRWFGTKHLLDLIHYYVCWILKSISLGFLRK